MNFNKVIILGNLTRDPEVRSLPSGQQVANFGVATNRFYMDRGGAKQQATEFHNVVAFGKLADICSRYLNKGKIVMVEGRLQTRSWQAPDGSKKYRTEIIMENMQLGPRTGNQPAGPSSQPSANQAPMEEEIPVIDTDDFGGNDKDGVNVNDIPF